MLPDERHNFIYNHLHQHQTATINQLAKLMEVSHMTIRRDIQSMVDEGKVIAISGGVKLHDALKQELPYVEKAMLHHQHKQKIGELAAQLIEAGQVIYLDAGTTSFEVARHIAKKLNKVTVITNDFTICNFLMNMSHINLFHTGGQVDLRNRSCVGSSAANFLLTLNIDVAFISTSSWDLTHGLSTPEEGKALVKKAIISASRRKILISDSSKYGKYGMFHISHLNELTDIICDNQLDAETQQNLRALGINLHLTHSRQGSGGHHA
ncbi:DeoR/GlpR family DNA-binding transcription regulator [Budvicia aquatica]|uniref:DeoR/GlpR transcriptional regulator n=1 Tax=Budvicia aquatica TaxID=82979 RepID=A0A2C6BUY0_9GAMM|nr:DeoR/GlpR family DNA-binding transcription regulator [Budvicia aquatica]PHI27960.1 DeoR/GlpR transcriptional regulator [Budvicia aquatica]VFS45704.1 HTH-type transcriptional repressor glcR [Budvicia aquatica]